MDELENERMYWLAFSLCNGIGSVRFQKLLHMFGSAKNAWHASVGELRTSGIGEKMIEALGDFKKKFSIAEYLEQMQRLGVTFLTLQDNDYPELLKLSKRPPIILYKKGTYKFNKNDKTVSVVGTRKITEYGREVTELLVTELVAAGCVIVSGLAMGVDAVAHSATIAAGGKTIAVLGSGVDICTPEENARLYQSILEKGGCIVSEYALGMMPNIGSFPARNRIIAGLSLGVLVTEGAADSGSLITANDAFSFGRKVFAVPGPITSSVSQGPIALIAKGAKMVTRGKDILEELDIKHTTRLKYNANFKNFSKEERLLIGLLQEQDFHFDELVKRSGLDASRLGTLLSMMEIGGLVKSIAGGFWKGKFL